MGLLVSSKLERAFIFDLFRHDWCSKNLSMSQLDDISSNKDRSFSYLDLGPFRSLYVDSHLPNRMNFYVTGMKCAKCVNKIEGLQKVLPSVRGLRVDISKSSVEVQLSNDSAYFAPVAEAIEKLGFQVKPLQAEQAEREQQQIQKEQDRLEIMRIGVAGYAAAQIMSFAFANYFGAGSEFRSLFNWISFLLYLPVLLFSAQPFYSGFWQSIKTRSLSIDGPIAVASVSGFIFSTWNLLIGKDGIYFDSISGFLFLILCSRAIQKRMVRNFLSSDIDLQTQLGDRIYSGTVNQWVPIHQIQEKQIYQLSPGQVLPMDSEIVSSDGIFSLAFLSGESKPKNFYRNSYVPSGAVYLSSTENGGSISVRALRKAQDSSYSKMLKEIKSMSLAKARIQEMADVWSKWLLISVFSAALVFLFLYSFVNVHQALERSLALIILACPCAMAFGTPLALAFSVRKAARKGFLVKSSDVFERLTQIKNIFIDKTGTLTEAKLKIRGHRFYVSDENQKNTFASVAFALEAKSVHPVAFSVRDYLYQKKLVSSQIHESPSINILNRVEIPGLGVKGIFQDQEYMIRSSGQSDLDLKRVSLFRFNHHQWEELISFEFEDELILGGSEAVSQLKQMGYRVYVLSGDQSSTVKKLAAKLKIEESDVFAEMTPQQKLQVIQSAEGPSLMIGDGVNDGLALAAAHVGIAVSGSVDVAFKTASVYMTRPGISDLPNLLIDSQSALNLVRRNLYISVIYNFSGGIAALLGFVNPFVAAILMPISSGFILFSSWFGSLENRRSKSEGDR